MLCGEILYSMPIRHLGYPCMNRTLRPDIRTNRSMTKTRFTDERPLQILGERIEQNLRDLQTVLEWNVAHNIYFYRISSNLIPLKTEFTLSELPNSDLIYTIGQSIGEYIQTNNIRVSFHPDHFVKLASPTERVRDNSIAELVEHAMIYDDILQLPRSFIYPINVHIGAHYNNKSKTKERFIDVYNSLPESVTSRLVLENDDSPSLWSLTELVDISEQCGIPITFDYHHHSLSGVQSYETALTDAISTWPNEVVPIVHYSEPQRIHKHDTKIKPEKHSEYVETIPLGDSKTQIDVMIEAGAKEKAILQLRS